MTPDDPNYETYIASIDDQEPEESSDDDWPHQEDIDT
jgi:hypothetical protein